MPTAELSKLFLVLETADYDLPDDLEAALGVLPSAGALPEPHTAWTAFAVVHYVERKRWAHEAVSTQLIHAWERARPPRRWQDATGRFVLAGRPEWEICLDGGLGDLTDRSTGERLHLDLFNGPGLCYPDQFLQYLLGHRQPGPAERRVLELHPQGKALRVAMDEILAAGALHEGDEEDFRVTGRLEGRADAIDAFLDAWENATPLTLVWLAARIGDWPAAAAAARALGDPALVRVTGPRAEACRRRRIGTLRTRVEEEGVDEATLHALADAGAEDLPSYLDGALREPEGATAAALELIWDDPAHVPAVAALYEQVRSRESRWPELRVPCATYLVRHGLRARAEIEALAEPGGEVAEAAVLALESVPDMAVPLLRDALRAESCLQRLTAAAALALVDQPWSRRELRAVLDGSDDPGATLECRAALRESRDPEARRAADEWESRHPGFEGVAPPPDRAFYDQVGSLEEQLAELMDQLRDRVLALRDRLPGEGLGSTVQGP